MDAVNRTDLYREAAKALGVPVPAEEYKKETLFDGIEFDPADPEGPCWCSTPCTSGAPARGSLVRWSVGPLFLVCALGTALDFAMDFVIRIA